MLPTGRLIQQEINGSEYTQREVATLIGSDTGAFYKIFNSKMLLTVDFAVRLEKVFGKGKAHEWLHYQVDYLLWRTKNGQGEGFYRKNIHNT